MINKLSIALLLVSLIITVGSVYGQETTDIITSNEIARSNPKREITFGGRMHRVGLLVDDGLRQSGYFMDSEQSPTVLHMQVSQFMNSTTSISGNFEVALQSNRPVFVSQDNPNPGTEVVIRKAEIVFDMANLGKISLGRGLASAFVANEVDISGTSQIALIVVGAMTPGIKFSDNTTNELSSVKVSDYFMNSEQLLFADRLRIDSKPFAGGCMLSGTIAADGRWDAAVRYYPEVAGWNIRTAFTYQRKPYRDVDHQGYFAFSSKHMHTGVTFTTALAAGTTDDNRHPKGYLLKTGWHNQISELGSTAVSIDFSQGKDPLNAGEKTQSIGAFAIQDINQLNLSLYTGYRQYKISNTNQNLNPIDTFTIGAIYSF